MMVALRQVAGPAGPAGVRADPGGTRRLGARSPSAHAQAQPGAVSRAVLKASPAGMATAARGRLVTRRLASASESSVTVEGTTMLSEDMNLDRFLGVLRACKSPMPSLRVCWRACCPSKRLEGPQTCSHGEPLRRGREAGQQRLRQYQQQGVLIYSSKCSHLSLQCSLAANESRTTANTTLLPSLHMACRQRPALVRDVQWGLSVRYGIAWLVTGGMKSDWRRLTEGLTCLNQARWPAGGARSCVRRSPRNNVARRNVKQGNSEDLVEFCEAGRMA
jgi:hypothetical protein